MEPYRILAGLPPYGLLAISFPVEFGRIGKEGFVVEFYPSRGNSWVGNFAPSISGDTQVFMHPDGTTVLVISSGACYAVDPEAKSAEIYFSSVFSVWHLNNPKRIVVNLQDISFACIGQQGILWRSSSISWDGFRNLSITEERLSGSSWSSDDNDSSRADFELDLQTGKHTGGSHPPV